MTGTKLRPERQADDMVEAMIIHTAMILSIGIVVLLTI